MTVPALDTNPYWSLDQAAAAEYGVPAALLSAQQWFESNWEAHGPNSSTGAEGIAQFEPGTAAAYGITNPYDPTQEIPAEAKYLADSYAQFGSWAAAVSSYDAGVGAVAANNGQVVPDTAQYVNNVINAAAAATPTATLTSSTTNGQPPQLGNNGGGGISGNVISPNPIQELISGAAGSVAKEVLNGGAYLVLLAAGIGLVVAGAYKLANPGTSITQSVKNTASNAKKAAGDLAVAAAA